LVPLSWALSFIAMQNTVVDDPLGTESRSLHHSLISKIDEIMKDASAVPVLKDGMIVPHLLQKARYVVFLSF
jgi:hypothetical protein